MIMKMIRLRWDRIYDSLIVNDFESLLIMNYVCKYENDYYKMLESKKHILIKSLEYNGYLKFVAFSLMVKMGMV